MYIPFLPIIKTALFSIFLVTFLCSASENNQPNNFSIYQKFYSFDKGEQLPTQEIGKILHDSFGFMWLATWGEGVSIYDGIKVVSIEELANHPQSEMLWSNYIQTVIEDLHGDIWIATSKGLNHFSRKSNKLTRIHLPNIKSKSDYIRNLLEDQSGNIWVSLMKEAAIYKIAQNNLTSAHRVELYKGNYSKKKYSPASMRQDSLGYIWIYQSDRKTIFNLSTSSNKVVDTFQVTTGDWAGIFKTNPTLGIKIEDGRRILPFRSDLYIYQEGVVNKFSLKEAIQSNGSLNIQDIQLDSLGRIWIATTSGLIELKADGTFYLHKENHLSINGLSSNFITGLSKDKQGNVWVSTFNGINFINIRKDNFIHIQPVSNVPETPSKKGAYAIHSDKYGYLWIGSSGLDIIGSPQLIRQQLKDRFEGISIRAIKPQGNTLWIATIGNGLFNIDYTKDKVTSIKHFNNIEGQLLDMSLSTDGKLWVAAYVSGLGYLDTEVGTYHSIPQVENKEIKYQFKELAVSSVLIGSNNHLWVGTQNRGLFQLTSDGDFLNHYLPKQNISSLYEDSKQRLWIGLDGEGLNILKNGIISTFGDLYPNSLISLTDKSVWATIEDKQGSLWLTTSIGLVKIAISNEIKMFNHIFGKQLQYFNANAIHRGNNDSLYFGGENGIALLTEHAKSKINKPVNKQTIAPLLKVNYQDIKLKSEGLLFVNLHENPSINLPPFENHLDLSISAPSPSNANEFEFFYKLNGLHNDWIKTKEKSHTVQLMNLASGSYTFETKLSHPSLPFIYKETQVAIHINKAWWQTWWGILTIILFSSIILVFTVWLKNRHLINKAKKLQQLVNDKTSTINSLLKQKQKMFANISHEFRTPLSLILVPIENMLKNELYTNETQGLNMIKRNSLRLLRLVDQLLELANLQSNTANKLQTFSVLETISLVLNSFEPIAKEKSLTMEVNSFKDIKLVLVEDSLDKILINIISNAIKYTPSHGQIKLTVSSTKKNISISVADNGIGVSKDNQEKIFKRFSRVPSQYDEYVPGTGIGLALVKELVEANMGSIMLDSEINEGCCFTVTFPRKENNQINLINDSQNNEQLNRTAEYYQLEVDSISHKLQEIEEYHPNEDDSRLSILIIEDNEDMRSLIIASLESKYTCLSASNGEKGVHLAINQIPDLIICDVMMPGIDGYEVANRIRDNECSSHIPIIMLTAKGDFESRMLGWKQNIDEYLTKPIQLEELKIRIKNLLSIRQLLKKRFGYELSRGDSLSIYKSLDIHHKDKSFIKRFEKIIANNYYDTNFNRSDTANLMALSERQLNRKLAALIDHNFSEYLKKYRLKKAILLLNKGLQVAQIGDEVGFSSTTYFSTCFKAEYGKTVKQYEIDSVDQISEPI